MKRNLTSVTTLFFVAAPALAHDGAHLHPHGSENWIAGLLILGLAAGIWALKSLHAQRAEAQQ